MSDGTIAGTWSPSPPTVTCAREYCVLTHININHFSAVDCGIPPSGTNASPGTPTSTTYQGAALYTCFIGYCITIGVTMVTATCMASGTWGPIPTCQRMWSWFSDQYELMWYKCSCRLWLPSNHSQGISWNTHSWHNSWRDGDLHLCQWVWGIQWSHYNNGYLYG